MSDKVQEAIARAEAEGRDPFLAGITALAVETFHDEHPQFTPQPGTGALPPTPEVPDCGSDLDKRFKIIKKVRFNLSLADVVKGLNEDDLVELVKAIDQQAASWDVTLELADYFTEQRHIHLKEYPEDAAARGDKEVTK